VKPLRDLVKEMRYRIFFYKSGRVLDDSDVTVSQYFSWFSGNCKFVLFDELPLDDFSKKLIRELYHDVLENHFLCTMDDFSSFCVGQLHRIERRRKLRLIPITQCPTVLAHRYRNGSFDTFCGFQHQTSHHKWSLIVVQ